MHPIHDSKLPATGISLKKFAVPVRMLSKSLNIAAGVAMTYVLAISVADMVMNKVFKNPINWAFDSIGLLAVLAIAFAIPEVQVKHGHIEVDMLMNRLSQIWKRITGFFVNTLGIALWGVIAWRSFVYGMDIFNAGEVSMSVGMLIYPFIFIQGICAGVVAIILISQTIMNSNRVNK